MYDLVYGFLVSKESGAALVGEWNKIIMLPYCCRFRSDHNYMGSPAMSIQKLNTTPTHLYYTVYCDNIFWYNLYSKIK